MAEDKVRVVFVTKYEEFRVTDTPLAVPSKLGRAGLSEVINHLLESSTPQPFDFMIDNRLIRMPLFKFLRKAKISVENIVTIEYMPAMSLLDETQEAELPSWIGSLDTNISDVVIAGCYDGNVKILDSDSLTEVSTFQAHNEPVRSVISFSSGFNSHWRDSSSKFIATASKDLSVKVWSLQKNGGVSNMAQVGLLTGHVNSVECMDYYNKENLLFTGDWNGNIFAWNLKELLENEPAVEDTSSSKRKKSKSNSGHAQAVVVKDMSPMFAIRAHSQSVSSIQMISHNANNGNGNGHGAGYDERNTFLSSSWDHSIKMWDIETHDCVTTLTGSKVLTSMHYSPFSKLIASSHTDGKVRLWDTRVKEETSSVDVLGSSNNTQWVSQVRWHPDSDVLLASSDYEGKVRVWDIRAAIPIGSYAAHDGKALCVDWISNGDNGVKVCSGGSDCVVKTAPLST